MFNVIIIDMKKILFLSVLLFLIGEKVFSQNFEITNINVTGTTGESIVFDANNDQKTDLLLIDNSNTKLYLTNETGYITSETEFSFLDRAFGGVSDLNNDGFIDIILSGNQAYGMENEFVLFIYKNTGENSFEKIESTGLPALVSGNISFMDFNSDGLVDVLLTGMDEQGYSKSIICKNKGDFKFDPLNAINLPSIRRGQAKFADYDNDGDFDILFSGEENTTEVESQSITCIVENINGQEFIEKDFELDQNGAGVVHWGDYNNDGFIDAFVYGKIFGLKIYKNIDGSSFEIQNIENLPKLENGDAAWNDFDNDGDLDIIFIGMEWIDEQWTYKSVYLEFNNGYTPIELNSENLKFNECHISSFDYKKDGDIDLIVSGISDTYQGKTVVLNNIIDAAINNAPSIPENLSIVGEIGLINLTWDSSEDTESQHVNYNVCIGISKNNMNILNAMASMETGESKIPFHYNTSKNNKKILLTNFSEGKYYWSVQAVDANGLSSDFAAIDSFNISANDIPLEKPTNLSFKKLNFHFAELFWIDNSGNEEGFAVECSINTDNDFEIAADIDADLQNYLTSKLSENTDYYYRIKAFNSKDTVYSDTIKIQNSDLPLFVKDIQNPLSEFASSSNGATFGDIDNDGDQDLYICGFELNRFYLNNGDGNFEYSEDYILNSVADKSLSANWIDYNNDGFVDLYLSMDSYSLNKLYLNNQDGTFSLKPNFSIKPEMKRNESAAWNDFNKDGLPDVLMCMSEDSSMLYLNLGEDKFQKIKLEQETGLFSIGANWIDMDNDGLDDIFVLNYGSNNYIYKNNGDSTFTKITDGALVNTASYSVSSAWTDIDNDGLMDVLICNNANNSNVFYLNEGDFSFSVAELPFAPGLTVPMVNSTVAIWEDFDNDGDLDLFSVSGTFNDLYINEGDLIFSKLENEPLCNESGYSNSVMCEDMNNDGALDLLIMNGDNQADYVYLNNTKNYTEEQGTKVSSNNRIMLKLVGQKNSFALGTRVKYNTIDGSQCRNVVCETGASKSLNKLIPGFGIGQNMSADIKIYWTPEKVQFHRVDQLNSIVELIEPEDNFIPNEDVNLNAEIIDQKVILNWQINNSSENEIHYLIEYKNSDDDFFKVIDIVDNTETYEHAPLNLQTENTYRIQLISKNMIMGNQSNEVMVISTGISDQTDNTTFVQVYPNPVSNHLYVDLEDEMLGAQLSVFDVCGKEVFTMDKINQNKIIVPFFNYAKGMYLIRIQNGEKSSINKVLKN